MTGTITDRLDRAVRAVARIVGVSVVNESDRATWTVQYDPAATAQERADGETVRATFDPTSQAAIDAQKAATASAIDGDLLIQAIAILDFEERQKLTVQAGQTLRTLAQCKARVKAIYLSLL